MAGVCWEGIRHRCSVDFGKYNQVGIRNIKNNRIGFDATKLWFENISNQIQITPGGSKVSLIPTDTNYEFVQFKVVTAPWACKGLVMSDKQPISGAGHAMYFQNKAMFSTKGFKEYKTFCCCSV